MLRTLMLSLLLALPAAGCAQSIDLIQFHGDAMSSYAVQSAVNAAIGQAAKDAAVGAAKQSEEKDRQREADLPFPLDPQVTRQVEDGFVAQLARHDPKLGEAVRQLVTQNRFRQVDRGREQPSPAPVSIWRKGQTRAQEAAAPAALTTVRGDRRQDAPSGSSRVGRGQCGCQAAPRTLPDRHPR